MSAMAFNDDGTILASGGRDGAVRLWNTASGTERRRFPAGNKIVSEVFFTSGGKSLVVVVYDSVHVWDVADGTEEAASDLLKQWAKGTADEPRMQAAKAAPKRQSRPDASKH